ncbi:MAG: ABC transporter ATP-binding protein [Alkalinema sp. RU_4_3]|nr:ABC transporter ATP-binding protein [Alkalinema sp. RU_4_3]
MSHPLLDVRNLQVQFKTGDRTVNAIKGISLQVYKGQTLGIVGESGSGKSVTSLAAMGLIPSPPGKITGGEIWFQETEESLRFDLASLPRKDLRQFRGGKMAMIFQEPMTSLNPVYTIGFQLVEAIRQHSDTTDAAARRQAIDLLQEVRVLAPDTVLQDQITAEAPALQGNDLTQELNRRKQASLDRYPHQLSGGQLQRVMIAMALSGNPSLLIADEPTTALDVTVQAAVLDLLRELRDRRGMGMIFITHDLGLIAEIADQVAVMYQGQIVETGSVLDIFSEPKHPYTQGLLTCRPRPDQRLKVLPTVSDFMDVTTGINGDIAISPKVTDMAQIMANLPVQTELEQSDRLTTLTKQEPLLSVQNLSVAFPVKGILGTKRYVMAVNDLSFDVYPGETLGLVGESGCGKTTLSRTLLGLIKPKVGKAYFEGRDIFAMGDRELRSLRREMQIIFQNPFSALDPRINIGDAIMEPLLIHGKTKTTAKERAAYLLDRVGLDPTWMKRFPHEFSGGQRQRVCIARALALNPKFIICDESVSALDVSVQAQVLNLLKELQSEFNLTYIFISHDLSVVKFMSDRIMVMNRGEIEELGSADRIYNEPQEAYTKQLISAIPIGSLDRIRERQSGRSL